MADLIDNALFEELDAEALKCAQFLKQYCKSTHCRDCKFYDSDSKWCKLETKKDSNFNTVPRDWKI